MKSLTKVKKNLKPGSVYRRADLVAWSSAVDRHIALLQKEHVLEKLAGGIYYCPKKTSFGKVPPPEKVLIASFLKDDRFLVMTPNYYNSLGVGTTQLYNKTVVYNHKRHGVFRLGNKYYNFFRKHHFPLELTQEFLLVDLVDNMKNLAEDKGDILKLVGLKAMEMDHEKLMSAVKEYGGVSSRNFFGGLMNEQLQHY